MEDNIPEVRPICFPLSVSHLHALSDNTCETRKQAVALARASNELYGWSEEDEEGSHQAKAVVTQQKVSPVHHNTARHLMLQLLTSGLQLTFDAAGCAAVILQRDKIAFEQMH